MKSALDLTCGAELEAFKPSTVVINHTRYTVLTGYEGIDGQCFWCGGKLRGKLKRYCYGHMTEYYNHFRWEYASYEAKKRANYKCENCGKGEGRLNNYSTQTNLEVHHIVPLKGEARFFSAYNLPFNLIALCHECHLEIHAVMRLPKCEPKCERKSDLWGEAERIGQIVMRLEMANV